MTFGPSRGPGSVLQRCAIGLAITVLTGQIVDKSTGQPLTGVTVTITGGAKRAPAHTDSQGNYRISGLTPGQYTVAVESDDVPPQHFALSVKSTKSQKFNIAGCSTTLDYSCAAAQP